MDMVNFVSAASEWLQNGERSNILTLLICAGALAYVAVRIARRMQAEREAARAAANDVMRVTARRYHESAWS